MPKASRDRGWVDIHMVKGVFVRFSFDELESRKFNDKSKTKQQRTLYVMYYIYSTRWYQSIFDCCHECYYIYISVGLSVLLVSTCRAMREPQFVKRVTR